MNSRGTKALIREIAGQVGFTAVGITTAAPIDDLDHLRDAIASGRTGEMAWLARDPAGRCDPQALLLGAKAVICCALAYGERGIPSRHPEPFDFAQGKLREGSPATRERGDSSLSLRMTSPAGMASSPVARFARGAEYHDAVRARLEKLWAAIQERHPRARARICVDTSPILEKALAQRSGLGWIGKHTVLLSERMGSWFALGEIVTDLEVEPDAPCADRCGGCAACIEACPTGALIAPYVLDARRCISYLTIEHKGPIPEAMRPFVPDGAYGCDRCQEACLYNKS